MSVLNIALISSEEFARSLGKKGDVRDIESYVFKENRDGEILSLSFLRPLKHPESIRPLLGVLDVAKAGVIELSRIDSHFGEIVVAFGCSGIEIGFVIIDSQADEWIDPEKVRVILDQAGLISWRIYDDSLKNHELREYLFSKISINDRQKESPLIIPVDQSFNVKGVGLVAIGYVQSGSISKFDDIEIIPTKVSGVVKSLQVMDDSVETAFTGDRVGIALRNVKTQIIQKGSIITNLDSYALEPKDQSDLFLEMAPFQKKILMEGDVIHASSNLQFVVGRILSIDKNKFSIKWDTPIWIRADGKSKITIVQLDAEPMRIIGVTKSN